MYHILLTWCYNLSRVIFYSAEPIFMHELRDGGNIGHRRNSIPFEIHG